MIKNLTNFQGPERKPERAKVSDDELDNMMMVLDAVYASHVKRTKTAMPICAAYNVQLLAEALKAQIQQRGLENVRETPLPDEVVQDMIDQIADYDAQTAVQDLFDKGNSRGFTGYLAWKLEMAWWNEARQNSPSQAELDEIAKKLGGNAQEKFEKDKASNPGKAYFHLLMATRPATFRTDTKELNSVLEQLGLRRSNRRPNGPGHPKNGGGFGGDHRGNRGPRGEKGEPNQGGPPFPPRDPHGPPKEQPEESPPAKAEKD